MSTASANFVYGLPCALPNCTRSEFLCAPIVFLDCPERHALHKQCFDWLNQLQTTSCPRCKAQFTKGVEDPALEKLTVKLGTLARSLLGLQEIGVSWDMGTEVLFEAIEKGENEIASLLLPNTSPHKVSHAECRYGLSPLYFACKHANTTMVRLLLERGASPLQKNDVRGHRNDYDNEHAATPMQIAAKQGNVQIVELLQQCGALIDELDENKRTPLFIATHAGLEDVALYLIGQGACITIKDGYGISLIAMAVRSGLLNVVRTLVGKGIAVTDVDEDGGNCLFDAIGSTGRKVELLDCLLKNGGTKIIDGRHCGQTPLSMAVHYTRCESDVECVKLLVAAGADLSLTYKSKYILGRQDNDLDILGVAEESYEQALSHDAGDEDYDQILRSKQTVLQFLRQQIAEKASTAGDAQGSCVAM